MSPLQAKRWMSDKFAAVYSKKGARCCHLAPSFSMLAHQSYHHASAAVTSITYQQLEPEPQLQQRSQQLQLQYPHPLLGEQNQPRLHQPL